ncbi:hypothetical protein FocnCong_v009533 [Fusarium oxysporum f. sp. conglutinans]|nr:hypothetical protein FocnCong_v009533 [Fusarium oxysporum f. sp. conglutinans]
MQLEWLSESDPSCAYSGVGIQEGAGKPGRAIWLDEEHHRHITARVRLGLERVRGVNGERSRSRQDTLEQRLPETSQEYPRRTLELVSVAPLSCRRFHRGEAWRVTLPADPGSSPPPADRDRGCYRGLSAAEGARIASPVAHRQRWLCNDLICPTTSIQLTASFLPLAAAHGPQYMTATTASSGHGTTNPQPQDPLIVFRQG